MTEELNESTSAPLPVNDTNNRNLRRIPVAFRVYGVGCRVQGSGFRINFEGTKGSDFWIVV